LATNALTSNFLVCIACQDAWMKATSSEQRGELAEEIFAPLVEAIKATLVESGLRTTNVGPPAKTEPPNEGGCTHGVKFDEGIANGLATPQDVREMFPRLHGRCPLGCGFEGLYYVNTAHYTMGDW